MDFLRTDPSHAMLKQTPLETIVRLDCCDSTMSYLEDLLRSVSRTRNILVQAGMQTAGIGRGKNCWISPPGGLWFSFSHPYPQTHPLISLYVGWCLHHVMIDLFPTLEEGLRIKWTNDIMYRDLKLAGVLCRHSAGRFIIGIGINTNDPKITAMNDLSAVSMMDIIGFEVSNAFILKEIMACFYNNLCLLDRAQTLVYQINRFLFAAQENVLVDQGDRSFSAIVLGVETDGGLTVLLPSGSTQTVYFGSLRCNHQN